MLQLRIPSVLKVAIWELRKKDW